MIVLKIYQDLILMNKIGGNNVNKLGRNIIKIVKVLVYP